MGKTMVSDLKDVIKGSEGITAPKMEMRLFLAKKGQNGVWLDTAGAEAVTFDESGKLPRDFEEMDPTLYLNDAECFGDEFEPERRQVHVLVVVPVDRAAKRQKVEPSTLVGIWRTVAAEMAELSKDLKPNHLEAGNMLAVPRKVFGTAFSNGLYIRREYWELYGIIQHVLASDKSRDRVLVLGSPGIGKSVFGVFLLLLFMVEKKDVAFHALLERVIYYFTWSDTNGYEISNSPRAGKSYEGLFDGSELEGKFVAPYFLHVYLFASPRTTNYNNFVKEGCFQVIMNPWTKAECQSLADINRIGDQDDWYQKFNLVGGRPRFVFSSSAAKTFDELVRRVKADIPQTKSTLEEAVQLFQKEVFRDDMKHIPFLFRRDPNTPSRPFLTYASVAVEAIVSARYNIQSAEQIRSLLKTPAPTLQSWRGKEMEKFLLQDLVTCEFCMKSLEGNDVGTTTNFDPLNAMTEIVQASSEIKDALMLHIPLSKTFPAIDGVLVVPVARHIFYVQSTVSKAHPIKYQRLKDVYEDLVGRRGDFQDYTHVLLFLVSNDMYDRFTAQPYQNEDGEKRHARLDIKMKQCAGKIVA
jgi:hypothetical protein